MFILPDDGGTRTSDPFWKCRSLGSTSSEKGNLTLEISVAGNNNITTTIR